MTFDSIYSHASSFRIPILNNPYQDQVGDREDTTGFITQSVKCFGLAHHHINETFKHQQVKTSNALSNTVGASIGNNQFYRYQTAMISPNANISLLSANNGDFNIHNVRTSTAESISGVAAEKHYNDCMTFPTVMEDHGTSINRVGGHLEYFLGPQLTQAPSSQRDGAVAFDRCTETKNNNSVNIWIRRNKSRRRVESGDIGVLRNLPIGKRMRISEEKGHNQQQSQNPSTSGSWKNTIDSINGNGCLLYTESDDRDLSQYQCLARKQMEIFEATPNDASRNAQGRNKPILVGQVGIRCKHCYTMSRKERKTGSVYYPNRLEGVYQTAQKMTVGHLIKYCSKIPEEIRAKLLLLKDQKSSDGGGKRYWANGVRLMGVKETPHGGLVIDRLSSHSLHLNNKQARENSVPT